MKARHTYIARKVEAIAVVLVVAIFSGCSSPPKPPEPTGQWVPVNPITAQVSRTQQK
ncbi:MULTISPECIES: hypothetical protein [Paraburkholderia]|uniref:hypothetical protein n=1 Tax=Paraburkholderia TaxID=1822464 RepID=UPI002AB6AF2F|nr:MULTISPECIES: hypothetical protein [Paraburkholderia]